MRMVLFLVTVTTHLVAPLPTHCLSAVLATVIGLSLRTGFTWLRESRQQMATA